LGGLVVASATIAPLEAATSSRVPAQAGFNAAQEIPLQYMNRDTFTRLIGTRFTVHTANSRTVPMTLIEVEDISTATVAAHTSSLRLRAPVMVGQVPAVSTRPMNTFTLRFRGSVGKPLTQDTYIFESGSLGKIALFIVPCSKNMRIPTYTAIINHLQ
jgi:hypothetical protein